MEGEKDGDEITLPDKCQSLRLRSIRKRIETEKNKHLPKQRKQRERPAPLSKYRNNFLSSSSECERLTRFFYQFVTRQTQTTLQP